FCGACGNNRTNRGGFQFAAARLPWFTGSERRTGFAWGAGVQFNPVENVVIDLGYEGSKVGAAKLNGVNVGVGYRF
ncbi:MULTISPECIES: Ail/Lom family outer membrane beta-barrel protein, partial [unclassified Salmonella]